MFRGAAIGFVVSMLLTAVATLMSTGAVHAQQGPQHVFSGYVSNHRQPLNEGFVRVFIGQAHEVASGDIRQGRYKLAVVQPAGDYFSGRTLRFVVVYQGIEYERPGQIGWQAGRTNEENFDIEGWQWHQGQPQRLPNQPQNDGGMNANQQARFDMERERMEREEEMRREEDQERRQMDRDRMEREEERQRDREDRDAEMRQDEQQSRRGMEEDMRREQMEMERDRMERETGMREKEGEERREMEREQMEAEEEMRREQMKLQAERQEREGKERMEMERQRMEQEDEMRRELMELERQRMQSGQPGVRPVGDESPQSGPGRGLFSNKKAGEATSGIDNIMDAGTLTIIGIVLTVLTTGMTLFKGD